MRAEEIPGILAGILEGVIVPAGEHRWSESTGEPVDRDWSLTEEWARSGPLDSEIDPLVRYALELELYLDRTGVAATTDMARCLRESSAVARALEESDHAIFVGEVECLPSDRLYTVTMQVFADLREGSA